MRTFPPALRTLPSSRKRTPRLRAASCGLTPRFFKLRLEPAATTKIERKRPSAAPISSTMPSAKYSWSGSPERLANGRMAIDGLPPRAAAAGAADIGGAVPRTRCSTAASTLRQAGEARSPVQPLRSSHWIWLNGIGGTAPSTLSCTSVPAARATSASARTQSDFTASGDQITSTALAARKRSSITSA